MLNDLKNTLEKIAGEAVYQAENLVKSGKNKYDEYVKVKNEMAEREAQANRERAEAEALAAKEKEAEQLRLEQEKLEAERARLMALSEKELMVEMVLSLNGFQSRLSELKKTQEAFEEEMDLLSSEQESLRENIEMLEKIVDNDKPFSFSRHPDD